MLLLPLYSKFLSLALGALVIALVISENGFFFAVVVVT